MHAMRTCTFASQTGSLNLRFKSLNAQPAAAARRRAGASPSHTPRAEDSRATPILLPSALSSHVKGPCATKASKAGAYISC